MQLKTYAQWKGYYSLPNKFRDLFNDYKILKEYHTRTPDQEVQFQATSDLIDGRMSV